MREGLYFLEPYNILWEDSWARVAWWIIIIHICICLDELLLDMCMLEQIMCEHMITRANALAGCIRF